ncbi:MAG: sulfatase [Armatimonadetes bacterium]|nr:sulfatase [Armatimonadota bacterium]
MDRRRFLNLAATVPAGVLLPRLSPRQTRDRPNVLFIAIDDLNDWIGCLGGHPDTQTPNLDALAARGVLFTSAHCAAPLCNPSRAALMTGLRPSTTGVYDNSQPFREAAPDAVTLAQHFMAHDYRVVGGGKILHGGFPDPASWQAYFPSLTRTHPDDPVPPNRPLNGIPNTAHFDWGPVDVPDEQMGDWQVADWARSELSKPQERPFFLGCGLFRPHLPWYVPRKYFDRFPVDSVTLPNVKENDLDDVPPMGVRFARPDGDHRKVLESNNWRRAVQGYLASIAFADACVGRVVAALDAGPHRDNTIVVLWSDHGWHLGEKLHWRKFALWEEATRNVFLIVAPGVTSPGGRCPRPVSLMDVYPTLIDLCGLAPREGLEGDTLMPLLADPNALRKAPAVTTYLQGNHSVRSERWRYIRYSDGSEELYDHSTDALEWTNLARDPQYAAVKADHARWLPEVNADPSPHANRGAE